MNPSNSSTFNSEAAEVAKLMRRTGLFATPFVVAAALVMAVDPYNFISRQSLIATDVKFPIARQHDPCFWKLNQYIDSPSPHLLLGDSRIAGLDVELIERLSGRQYANLGYGGGSLREALESFTIAAGEVELKSVTIGINLDKYNDYELVNRVQFYRHARANPALYFVNRGVWRSGIDCLYYAWTGKPFTGGVPTVTTETFWREQLATQNLYFVRYVEPVAYRRDLEKLAMECRTEQIELTFLIMPTHADIQTLVNKAGLSEANRKMRHELAQWGRVIDLDWEHDFTANRENFKDPVHLTASAQVQAIQAIWGTDTAGLTRVSTPK